ncbi:MAG: YihY/virulence factor BrkB family protein [Acidobacteriota bacterium]|nr:YihY/virulence factor BrkB family protein [Acidobacteriota bacterium]
MGAALAYYTLLSIAPLMIVVVAICGLVFKNSAETDVLRQTADVMGPAAAKTLKGILDNSHHAGSGVFATVVALVTLLFGASGVFMELRSALNRIWEVPPRVSARWRGAVSQRLMSFAMVLALGILLLVSLLLSAAFAMVQKFATGYLPPLAAITGEILNFVVSTVALGVLFSLIFRLVPERRLPWHVVTTGGAVTAVLFSIGKSLLAIYLTTAAVGSTYGAAGSLVAFIVWVYYSAQIFFFGAVFTKVYADSRAIRA